MRYFIVSAQSLESPARNGHIYISTKGLVLHRGSASSWSRKVICVCFSMHKPVLNPTQCVWGTISTCSLRAFLRFLTGGAEFRLAVSPRFNLKMQWDYHMTEAGHNQWLLICYKTHWNCRLMRTMFCNRRKSKKVLKILLVTEQMPKRNCCFQGWPQSVLCLHPTLSPASSSLIPTKFTSSISIWWRLLCGLPLDLLSIRSSLSIPQYYSLLCSNHLSLASPSLSPKHFYLCYLQSKSCLSIPSL